MAPLRTGVVPQLALDDFQVVEALGDVGVVCGQGFASDRQCLLMAPLRTGVVTQLALHDSQVVETIGDVEAVGRQRLAAVRQRLLIAPLRSRIVSLLTLTLPRLKRLWAMSGWSGGRALRRMANASS